MMEAHRTYIPAAGHDWTLPCYDPLVKLLGGNSARAALVNQAELQPAERVLEIGSCRSPKRHPPRCRLISHATHDTIGARWRRSC